MRKNKNEIVRLQSIIENDRVNPSDRFNGILVSDLRKLLREYFDFNDIPKLVIERSGTDFLVSINITASRIKNFINID